MLQIVSCCSIMLRRILQPCVDGLEAKLYQSKKKEAGCGRWHLLEVPLELLRGPLVEKEAGSAEEGSWISRRWCLSEAATSRRRASKSEVFLGGD